MECRALYLAPKDRHLVAEHDDLDREVGVVATSEPHELEDAPERPVQKGEGHPTILVVYRQDVKAQLTDVDGILGTDRPALSR